MRVVVAEDDLLVRQGVVALLETQHDFEVVAAVTDLASLLEAVDRHRPDVVLTDIRMPPDHTDEGIRAAATIADRHPSVAIVILSQYDEPEYAIRLLSDGTEGRGYLMKERVSDVDQLASAIRQVAGGGSFVDAKVVERLVAADRTESSPLQWLTDREVDVLAEMARGKDNRAIGSTLTITVRSVEKHINSIFSKLALAETPGISKRVAAVLTFLGQPDSQA